MSLSIFVSLQTANYGSVYVLTGRVFSNHSAVSDACCFDCVLHFSNFNVSNYAPTSCSSVLQVFSGFEQQIIFCSIVGDRALL